MSEGLGKWAAYYRKNGWSVFPVHGVRSGPSGGACTCGNPDCTNTAKHPMVSGWKEAMTGLDVDIHWEKWPAANIGVHCDNLLVVDLDGKEGIENFRNLRMNHNTPAPLTPTSRTGGGGYHLFFKQVEGAKNSVALVPKVDIRTLSGYIIAPPSRSLKGSYDWVEGREPWNVPLAEAPQWLQKMVRPRPIPPKAKNPREPWIVADNEVDLFAEGSRHDSMVSLCGRVMRARTGVGLVDVDEVLPEVRKDLLRFNKTKCKPPLPDREVLRIVENIARLRRRAA